jgi:hypothetical protein
VALQLDVGVVAAEYADDAIEQAADAEPFGGKQRTAGHRDQPGSEAVELLDRQRTLAFRRAQLHPRQQAAQVAPAVLRRAQHRKGKRAGLGPGTWGLARFDRQFRANQRADPGGERRLMKTRRAGDAIAIEQRDRRIAEHRRSIDEHFGQRCGT